MLPAGRGAKSRKPDVFAIAPLHAYAPQPAACSRYLYPLAAGYKLRIIVGRDTVDVTIFKRPRFIVSHAAFVKISANILSPIVDLYNAIALPIGGYDVAHLWSDT